MDHGEEQTPEARKPFQLPVLFKKRKPVRSE
jgi:hypothetical protein